MTTTKGTGHPRDGAVSDVQRDIEWVATHTPSEIAAALAAGELNDLAKSGPPKKATT